MTVMGRTTGSFGKSSLTMRILHHDSTNLGNPLSLLLRGLIRHIDELEFGELCHGCLVGKERYTRLNENKAQQ